jgi:GAF domain-containing protein
MSDRGLQRVIERLADTLTRDLIVQTTVNNLRDVLHVDRIVLYYFYGEWEGRVTYESLRSSKFSILGSTGPDQCFNREYAQLYLEGRVRAIADIETECINPCHRDFLRSMQVRANLVVPVLKQGKLWGLLVAHHCQDTHSWLESDIAAMREAAKTIAMAPAIQVT